MSKKKDRKKAEKLNADKNLNNNINKEESNQEQKVVVEEDTSQCPTIRGWSKSNLPDSFCRLVVCPHIFVVADTWRILFGTA